MDPQLARLLGPHRSTFVAALSLSVVTGCTLPTKPPTAATFPAAAVDEQVPLGKVRTGFVERANSPTEAAEAASHATATKFPREFVVTPPGDKDARKLAFDSVRVLDLSLEKGFIRMELVRRKNVVVAVDVPLEQWGSGLWVSGAFGVPGDGSPSKSVYHYLTLFGAKQTKFTIRRRSVQSIAQSGMFTKTEEVTVSFEASNQ